MSINTNPSFRSSVEDNIATIQVCPWLGDKQTYKVKGVRVIGNTKTPIDMSVKANLIDAEQVVGEAHGWGMTKGIMFFPSDQHTDPRPEGATGVRTRMKMMLVVKNDQAYTYALTHDTNPEVKNVDFYTITK